MRQVFAQPTRENKTVKTLRNALGPLIAVILIFCLIKPFVETRNHLENVALQIQWPWLIPSFVILLLYRSGYTYPFATLLSGITQNRVSFRDAFTLFHLANVTRYLPGRIWGFVRLLALSQRFGLSKTAVGSSLTLHVGIETTLGGFVAMTLLFSEEMYHIARRVVLERAPSHSVFFVIGGVGMIVLLLFFIPQVFSRAHQFLSTLRETGRPLVQKAFLHQWLGIVGGHILLWFCLGGAFFLFVQSLVSVSWRFAVMLIACYAFAWLCGFLSFLTPGGLGVRESLLGLLLSTYMPVPQAILVALLCRVWMLSAELLLAGVAFFLKWRTKT